MADKLEPTQVDSAKLRAELIKTIKGTIDTYSKTIEKIRSRELKKAELCLLCGNEDKVGKCTCLSKNDVMGYGDAGGPPTGSSGNAAGPMMASEMNKGENEPVKCPGCGRGLALKPEHKAAAKAKGTMCSDCQHDGHKAVRNSIEANKVNKAEEVQGAKAVKDKPEPGAKMPDKGDKDDQPDEGSGGLEKDESLAGMKAPGKAGRTVADLRARSMHSDTASSLADVKGLPGNSKNNMAGMQAHVASLSAKPKLPMVKNEDSALIHHQCSFCKAPATRITDTHARGARDVACAEHADKIGPKTRAFKPASKPIKKDEMSPRYGDKVGITTDKHSISGKNLTKLNAGKGGPVPAVRKGELEKTSVEQANKELSGAKSIASNPTAMPGGKMATPKMPAMPKLPSVKKTSVEEANKELSGAKSIAKRPIPGMGTKIANPQAMSPGKGMPKPTSGTINKGEKKSNKDRLKEVLGKCGMCGKSEHLGKCMMKEESMAVPPPPTAGFNSANHSRAMLKIKR